MPGHAGYDAGSRRDMPASPPRKPATRPNGATTPMLTDLYDRLAYSPTAGIALGFALTLVLYLVWLAIRPWVRARLGRVNERPTRRPISPRPPRV